MSFVKTLPTAIAATLVVALLVGIGACSKTGEVASNTESSQAALDAAPASDAIAAAPAPARPDIKRPQ